MNNKVVYSLMVIFLLAGCDWVSVKSSASHFFEDPNCNISCWKNLRPGDNRLTVSAFYEKELLKYNEHSLGFYAVSKEGYSVDSYFTNNNLVRIVLMSPDGFDLTIEKIIATLGKPQYIFFNSELSVEVPILYPYVTLYYPGSGYIFRVNFPEVDFRSMQVRVCIQPTSSINVIDIVKPGSIQSVLIDSGYGSLNQMNKSQVDQFVNSLISWNGYDCKKL